MRFFRKLPVFLVLCLACVVSASAVEDGFSDGLPPVPDTLTTVEESENPVSVDVSETEKEININVQLTPPSVTVQTGEPVVNVETPAVSVSPVDLSPIASLMESAGVSESESNPESVLASAPYSVLSLATPDRSGDAPGDTVRAVLESLFGEYQPRTQTVTQYLADGSSVTYEEYVPGLAGLDWSWIASVGLFALMLFCLFRLLGGVIVRV